RAGRAEGLGRGIRASGIFEESRLELNRAGQVVVGPNLLAKGEQCVYALVTAPASCPRVQFGRCPRPPSCQPTGLAPDPPPAGLSAQGQADAAIPLPRPRCAGLAQRLHPSERSAASGSSRAASSKAASRS